MRRRLEALRRWVRPALAALCALLVVYGSVRFAHRPFMAAREDLLRRLEQQRREVAALRQEYARSAQLRAQLEDLRRRVQAAEEDLERSRRQPSFLRYAEEQAAAAGVAITSLEFGEVQPIPQTPYAHYRIVLRAMGPYPGMVDFLGSLERVFPHVRIEALELSAGLPHAPTGGGAPGGGGSPPPPPLPPGWVSASVTLAVLARPDGTSRWDEEMRRWASSPGRVNPFAPARGE